MLKGGSVAVGGRRRCLRCMTGGGAGSELVKLSVAFFVVKWTEPHDAQPQGIIIVMSVDICRAAALAWRSCQLAVAHRMLDRLMGQSLFSILGLPHFVTCGSPTMFLAFNRKISTLAFWASGLAAISLHQSNPLPLATALATVARMQGFRGFCLAHAIAPA